jgi:N-acetylmuramoyl-L-alanine amidase
MTSSVYASHGSRPEGPGVSIDNIAAATRTGSTGSVLVLDPGHGGDEPGACVYGPGAGDIIREADLNLAFADSLRAALEKAGLRVLLTRYSDLDVPFAARVRAAEGADVFISVHHNSAGPREARGFEVFVSTHDSPLKARSLEIARAIVLAVAGQEAYSLTRATAPGTQRLESHAPELRQLRDTGSEFIRHGGGSVPAAPVLERWGIPLRRPPIKEMDLVVLRHDHCPAVLLEVCFMSNAKELQTAQDSEFRRETAAALATGLIQSFQIGEREASPPFKQEQDREEA